MADLWSLPSPPDSDDSAAIEDIISQAIDLSTLEQIAALNSSLASDSVLPNDLETRFRKLKSFPGAHPNPDKVRKQTSPCAEEKETRSFSDELLKPDELLSDYYSPAREREFETNAPDEFKNAGKELHHPKSRSGSFSFSPLPSISSKEAASRSPPKQACCFWCSPKKVSRKKSKGERGFGEDGESLSNLSSFSLKDHQRKMEKMLKEQEEMISREAEKVLKWAKQVSAAK